MHKRLLKKAIENRMGKDMLVFQIGRGLHCEKLIGENLLQNNKILVLPFGGGEDIESFLNIDYFDNSNRNLYLIIDSDKHENKEDQQNQRAANFEIKPNGKAYVISKSCIENYYHPRAFEHVYGLEENTFDFFVTMNMAEKR